MTRNLAFTNSSSDYDKQSLMREFSDLEKNLNNLSGNQTEQKKFLFSYISRNIHDLNKLERLLKSFQMHVESAEEEKIFIKLRNEVIIDYLAASADSQASANNFMLMLIKQFVAKSDYASMAQIMHDAGLDDYATIIIQKLYPNEFDRARFISDNFQAWFTNGHIKILRLFIASIQNNDLAAAIARDARIQDEEDKLSNFNYLIFAFHRLPKNYEYLRVILQNKKTFECLKEDSIAILWNKYFSKKTLQNVNDIPVSSLFFFYVEIMEEDASQFISMFKPQYQDLIKKNL